MASTTMQGNAYMPKYAAELIANARKLVTPGKGILAADESTGTIGKRVRAVLCALEDKAIVAGLQRADAGDGGGRGAARESFLFFLAIVSRSPARWCPHCWPARQAPHHARSRAERGGI